MRRAVNASRETRRGETSRTEGSGGACKGPVKIGAEKGDSWQQQREAAIYTKRAVLYVCMYIGAWCK